jgi:hypothetical protein
MVGPEVGNLESPGERGGETIGDLQEQVRAGKERMGIGDYAWGEIFMPDLDATRMSGVIT